MKIQLTAALLIFSAAAFGQVAVCAGSPVTCTVGTTATSAQIKPRAVPTSPTAATSVDAYIVTLTITNTTAGAITFTLTDQQASPTDLMTAVSIAANSTYIVPIPNGAYIWCPGGFKVSAGGAGLNWYAKWAQ